jgi:beta-N-acetylhexosaminidase
VFPISKDSATKIVFVSPGKTPAGGGAVDSGEEKTREPHTPASYIKSLKSYNPSTIDIRFLDSIPLSSESEESIEEADVIIFATRNASLSPYQKDFGLSLGKKFGRKLVVVATCDPYDFLEEVDEIKNYITIYEPTIPAFKSAADIIFGTSQPLGHLPVSVRQTAHNIRPFNGSEEDIDHIWKLWESIFPTWRIDRGRLATILRKKGQYYIPSQHYVHDQGFCLGYLDGVSGTGFISCVGVLESHRGQGIGTALITKARQEIRKTALSSGLKGPKYLGIVSSFPRFWPGVPCSFPSQVKDFFLHRGESASHACLIC